MTKISKMRGYTVPETMPFVNYLANTEGELSLQYAKQKLWLFHHIFPDKEKIWAKGATLIDNILYNAKKEGVHGQTPFLGSVPPELNFVAQRILSAKNKFAPASGDMYIGRLDPRKGLNPEIGLIGINGADTIFDDAFKAFKEMNAGCFVHKFDMSNGQTKVTVTDSFINLQCQQTFELMLKLNTMLPKNSHNGIYAFMPIADANNPSLTPAVTASKVNDHLKYVAQLTNVAGLSNVNLKDWLRNCVMHKNAFNQIPSLTPESNIELLRANPQWSTKDNWNNEDQHKIGEPISFMLILLVIVVAKSLGGLIQICKNKEPTAFQGLDDIAMRAMDFAASGTDFLGAGKDKDPNTGGGGGTTEDTEATCKLKTGYTWNALTKTCDKDEVKTPTKEWIEGVPNVAVIGGAALLGGALLLK